MYGQMGQTEYIINKVKEETGMYDAKVVVTGGLGRIISNETENDGCMIGSDIKGHKPRVSQAEPQGSEVIVWIFIRYESFR